MNEEKFIQALRESMEQERNIDFSLAAWQGLEERLGKEKKDTRRYLWWFFPLLLGITIIIWQWKSLQQIQKQIEDLKKENSVIIHRKDTVFEKIIIYQYDTIRETVIEPSTLPILIVPKDSLKRGNPNKQIGLSNLPSLQSIQKIEIPKQEKIDRIAIAKSKNNALPKSLIISNEEVLSYYKSWNLYDRERSRFNFDWFSIQLMLDIEKTRSNYWKPMEAFQPPEISYEMMHFSNENLPISLPVLLEPLFPDKWNINENNVTVELGLDYQFKGERWQPFVGLSVAGNWGKHLNSEAMYGFSPNNLYNIPLVGIPNLPLEIQTGEPTLNPIAGEINPNLKPFNTQIRSYRQAIEMWYELNVGMRYNF